MANLNALLNQRVNKKSDQASKMAAMATRSSTGNLTSFSGVFSVTELSQSDQHSIEEILKQYSQGEEDIDSDLKLLISITCEVKAINNQAALLHGERIKRAHQILIKYREGAFTAWLLAAYGNRQTPYNLMQYFDFYQVLPKDLRLQMETMPRQAIYTLASRDGSIEKKKEIVRNYNGESKSQVIQLIRQVFPLKQHDKRQQKIGYGLIENLVRISKQLKQIHFELEENQKKAIRNLLNELQRLVK